jgi:hypothetical protein
MRRSLALLVALTLGLAACSSAPQESTFGNENERERDDKKGKARKNQRKKKDPPKSAAEVEAIATASPGTAAAKTVKDLPSPVDTSDYGVGPEYSRGRSSFDDPDDDATKQGLTPSYAEMSAASVEGQGDTFRLTIELKDPPPQKMPDDKTFMIVAFGLRGREDSATFGAQATEKGWEPYAGRSNKKSKEREEFPGQFQIEGTSLIFTVPWSYIGGAYEFEWQATAAWFASVADTTHYAYDTAPNEANTAHYPQ